MFLKEKKKKKMLIHIINFEVVAITPCQFTQTLHTC